MSILPLIDSASLLPCESKKPNCPLPIHTPLGGGGGVVGAGVAGAGAGASSAHALNTDPRTSAAVAMTRTRDTMLLTVNEWDAGAHRAGVRPLRRDSRP